MWISRRRRLPQFILISSFCVQVDGDDEAVETEDFCENEDEDHANKESGLLCGPANAGVSNDADGVSGSEARQTHG